MVFLYLNVSYEGFAETLILLRGSPPLYLFEKNKNKKVVNPMEVKNSKYLRFIDYALELCKKIPRHFSKFSNKIFCLDEKLLFFHLL